MPRLARVTKPAVGRAGGRTRVGVRVPKDRSRGQFNSHTLLGEWSSCQHRHDSLAGSGVWLSMLFPLIRSRVVKTTGYSGAGWQPV